MTFKIGIFKETHLDIVSSKSISTLAKKLGTKVVEKEDDEKETTQVSSVDCSTVVQFFRKAFICLVLSLQ